MAKLAASGFTISGLLDKSASVRNDYPVEKIPVGEIAGMRSTSNSHAALSPCSRQSALFGRIESKSEGRSVSVMLAKRDLLA